MKWVLLACERSGVVREAFNAYAGIRALSCDLVPADDGRSDYHIQGDVRRVLDHGWDLMIAFPPCTYLCCSGLHRNKNNPERQKKTDDAIAFVRSLLDAPILLKGLENPIGCISTRIRKPDQIIQPWQFGENASKATCLWLQGLPLLVPTLTVAPRMVNGKRRWDNQTDSGQNRLGPSKTRAIERSITYAGIADAMASQWVKILLGR